MADSAQPPAALDRLFELSLIGLPVSGFFAIVFGGAVGAGAAAVFLGCVAWRTALALGVLRGEPNRKLAALPALLFLAFYPLDVALVSRDFTTATIRLLVLFTGLKLLVARSPRDYAYVGLLGFLELLAASMFVEGLAYLVALAAFLGCAAVGYAVYELRRGWATSSRAITTARARRGLPGRIIRSGGGLAAGILLAGSALFLVLPRPQASGGPVRLYDETAVGFSNTVDLGQIGALKADPTPVMRVESLDDSSLSGLYWRGAVLFDFDGRRWSAPGARARKLSGAGGDYGLWSGHGRRDGEGRRVSYRVKLEPLGADVLFLAGSVEEVRGQFQSLRVSDLGVVRTGERPTSPRVYEAVSWVPDRSQIQPSDVIELFSRRFQGRYLALPKLDPRVAELAAQVVEGEIYPLRKAQRIEAHLRSGYGYTLELPDRLEDDPLAHFLFERREGHCEYFSTAMAMMLRTEGIPSRIVNGFAGGVRNPLTGASVLRSSDAHSWVEAYIAGYGWLEFDPTPPAPLFLLSRWGAEVANVWEALQASWGAWVVGYGADNQIELARGLQRATRAAALWVVDAIDNVRRLLSGDWSAAAELSGVLGVIAFALLALFAARRLVRLGKSWKARRGGGLARQYYERAVKALAKRGVSRAPDRTAEEFQEEIADARLRGLMRQVTAAYNAARFGGDAEAENRLPDLVRALERTR